MANLTESPIYEPGIFQLEKSTPALGGAPVIDSGVPSAGHANAQALQLANRTSYLKQQLDAAGSATNLSTDLSNNSDITKGAALVGYDSGTVADVLSYAKPISNYTTLRSYTGSAKAIKIYADANISGVFVYDQTDTSSIDNNGTIIVDSSNRRWKRRYTGPLDLRWFGANPDDTTDSSDAIEAALKLNQPILVRGLFVASRRFLATGSQWLYGIGKDFSRIRWVSTAASAGIRVTPLTLDDQISYQDLELRCETTNGVGEAFLFSNWSGLSGYTTFTNFSTKFRLEGCVVKCIGAGAATKLVEVRNLFGGLFRNNHLYGTPRVLSTDSPAAFPTTHLIHCSNDGTASNTVGMKFYDNHGYYAVTGVWIDDVEGVEFERNDLQVCWNGLWVVNTIRKVNQYRISHGHYGCANTAVYIKNARHVEVDGAELSWGSNRTNGATIIYVIMESIIDLRFVNNTVRGNAATTTYGHNITGLQLTGVSGDLTIAPIVDINSWDALTTACVQEVNTSLLNFGLGNNFNAVTNQIVNNLGVGSAPAIRYGSGPHANPSGVGPLVLFTSIQQAPFALNRSGNTGTLATWHNDNGVSSGSITINATSVSYNTTSDMTLKKDLGIYATETAVEILNDIIIRKYSWKVNNRISEGVFAQELYDIFPEAVFKGFWFVIAEDGSEEIVEEGTDGAQYMPWSVDYSKLVPILISGFQYMTKKIDSIENRLQILGM